MARRPAGINPSGLSRARENLGRPVDSGDLESTLTGRGRPPLEQSQPLTTGWVDVSSSRVSAYMYDYSSGTLYLHWQNRSTTWAYFNVSSALFEAFAASPSKGKYVNSSLNLHSHSQVSDPG